MLGLVHERWEVHREGLCQTIEIDDTDIAATAFDITDVGRVETRSLGQALLRHAALDTEASNGSAERLEKLVRCPDCHQQNLWWLRR